ncbi:MAG: ATP-binding SpoIIE family protein phosphatase [Acidimicrobiales bacterium]
MRELRTDATGLPLPVPLEGAAFPQSSSRVEMLGAVARRLHGRGDVDSKLSWVVDQACRATGASSGAFVGIESRGGITAAWGTSPADIERFARPLVERLLGPRRQAGAVLRSGELAENRRYRALVKRLGLPAATGCLVVPVPSADGPSHGALILFHSKATAFPADDESLVRALAAHAGVALDNAEAMKRLAELQAVQREIVHQLQEAVRPPVPAVEGAELGVHYVSADPTSPTGGDLYDWLVLPGGDLHVAVVDVMGKGVAATQEALVVVHALRLLALDGCPIGDLVARAADLATAQSPDLMATVLVLRYSAGDGKVEVAGGGHPPAVLVRSNGEVEMVPAPGSPIGFPLAGTDEVVKLDLGRNDTLILYTDGLVEATKDILAGFDRLTEAAGEMARYPAGHLARALVERSLAGAVRRDDSLALVLRRRSPPGAQTFVVPLGAFEYHFSPSPATIPLGRHLLGDWLEHLTIDDEEAADLILVASELCANAVRHATGAPGALALRAWAEGDTVVVEVEDDGAGFELTERYDDEVPGIDGEQGRGLFVAEALADEITVRRACGRTYVRAVRRAVLPPP